MDEQHDRDDADTLPAGPGEPGAGSLTRRAAIGAAIGGIAALAAQAAGLARPTPAAAWNFGPMLVGTENEGTHRTFLDCSSYDTAFEAWSAGGAGLKGVSNSDRAGGVYGLNTSRHGPGVFGENYVSHTVGTLGSEWTAVAGEVSREDCFAINGTARHAEAVAVVGRNPTRFTAGEIGGKAGVFALADEDQTDADALWVRGPVRFERAGRIGIPAGAIEASRAVPHLHPWTAVIATLQTPSSVAIASAGIDADALNILIRLSGPAPYGLTVAYLLFEIAP